MTTTQHTPTGQPGARTSRRYEPVPDFETWMRLARTTYGRFVDGVARLDGEDWVHPTPCAGWTVRDMAGHVLGAMRSAASLRELVSQQREVKRRARRTGRNEVDVMTALQIERTAGLDDTALVAEMRSLIEPAVGGRRRPPGPVRRAVKVRVEMGQLSEKWSLDYLNGCILTRDAWLHRVDLADALGRSVDADDVDAVIVGDVACEWARRHGRPVSVRLTGGAGGLLEVGSGGPLIELDAIQFCRMVSGRAEPTHELLEQFVPF